MTEKDLLCLIIAQNESSKYLLTKLKVADFFDPRIRIIFHLVQLVYKQHNTVLGKEACLLMLKNLEKNETVQDCIALLEGLEPISINICELSPFLTSIIKSQVKQVLDSDLPIDKMRERVLSVFNNFTVSYDTIRLNEVFEITRERIVTPWEELNNALPESFNKGDLCLVLAGVNVGKTMFLCNLCTSPYLKKKVVSFISCEDGELRIKQRLDKMLGDSARWFTENEIDFKILKAYSPKLATIKEIAKDSDIVILDYLDRVNTNITEFRFMLRYISEGLKAIAEEEKCLIWTAKQIRREGLTKQIITMGDIGESFAVCESPDLILGMSIHENKCYLNIAKSRDVRYSDFIILNCDVINQRIS